MPSDAEYRINRLVHTPSNLNNNISVCVTVVGDRLIRIHEAFDIDGGKFVY